MKIHGYILFLSGSDDDRVVIATNERKRIVEEAISAFSVEGREQRILDAIEENEANETTKRCPNSLSGSEKVAEHGSGACRHRGHFVGRQR